MKRTPLKRKAPIRRKKSGHKHEKERLDKLCRAVVMARDKGQCVKCGQRENLQWAHVQSRRYISCRWRLENSMTLCAGHHLWWHHKPLESAAWFTETFPKRAKALQSISAFKQKVDLKLERLALLAEGQKLGVDLIPFSE